MTCPECGAQLTASARFCHKCGWDSKLAGAGAGASHASDRPAWKRRTMSVTLLLSGLLVFLLLLVPRGEADTTLIPGQAAPDFTLPAVDGGQVSLSSLKGKPVIVNFWASWCTPCRKEMPDFQQVYDRYKEQGLTVLGVNVGDAKVGVTDFRDQVKVNFPLLMDVETEVQTAYKIMPLPATFFIDRSGTIRAIYQYQMSSGQIEAEVLRLLAN